MHLTHVESNLGKNFSAVASCSEVEAINVLVVKLHPFSQCTACFDQVRTPFERFMRALEAGALALKA